MKQNSRLDTSTRVETARTAAFVVLCEWSRTEQFATTLLDTVFQRNDLSERDRRLATELVYGTIRRKATLDVLLQAAVDRQKDTVEPELWQLLRLGAYQLVYLESIPDHAAVAETVALAHAFQKKRWAGFANAVLRNVTRLLADQYASQPQPNAIPIAEHRHRIIEQELFPDIRQKPVEYIANALSYPQWLIKRWQVEFGLEETLRLAYWFQQPAGICLRINALKTEAEQLQAAFHSQNIAASSGRIPEAIWLSNAVPISSLPGFAEGWFTVQDESAMQAARLLNPQPGDRVLDLCAAPGTKTTHLAELMHNQGEIIACDIQPDRLKRVQQNADRLGIDIIKTTLISDTGSDIPNGPFDTVLLDVPCSNTGVLQKRSEVRWRINASDIAELAAIGRRLLSQAVELLKPGGRVVYSTCSIETEENEQAVQSILAETESLSLIEELQHRPGLPGDGGYQALLAKHK